MANRLGRLGGRGWRLCIGALLLISCMPDIGQTDKNIAECTLAPSSPNIYSQDPETTAFVIYSSATTPNPPQGQQYENARYAALHALAYQVWRWSDYIDVQTTDHNNLRITVTFISPELAEIIYLNQALLSHEILQDFNAQKMNLLNNLAGRDELLFLITITGTKYDNDQPIVLDIPIEQINLMNASKQSVSPRHVDGNLNELIRLMRGPATGYLAYQIATKNGDSCDLTLDQKWNNNMTISVPNLQVDGRDSGPRSWTIKYTPLMPIGSPSTGPFVPILPVGYDINRLSPSPIAPSPQANVPVRDRIYNDPYWEDLARFIWGEITLDNFK